MPEIIFSSREANENAKAGRNALFFVQEKMAWALALVASGALQLVCDDKKGSNLAGANALRRTERWGGARSASGGASSEATSNDAGGGSGNSGDKSDAASDDSGAGSRPADSGEGDDDNSSASNEAQGKPSAHRLQDVMNAWSTVKQTLSLKFIGSSILLTFIKLYPEYQEYFSDLVGVPLEEMEKDKRFNALSVAFMYNLDSLFDNLDDEELVEILAKQVGHQFSILGLSEKPFLDMRNLILHMMERYHKRYSNRFPLGIVESASHTVGWLWSLITHGLQATEAEKVTGNEEDEEAARRRAGSRLRIRPRLHPHLRGHPRPLLRPKN